MRPKSDKELVKDFLGGKTDGYSKDAVIYDNVIAERYGRTWCAKVGGVYLADHEVPYWVRGVLLDGIREKQQQVLTISFRAMNRFGVDSRAWNRDFCVKILDYKDRVAMTSGPVEEDYQEFENSVREIYSYAGSFKEEGGFKTFEMGCHVLLSVASGVMYRRPPSVNFPDNFDSRLPAIILCGCDGGNYFCTELLDQKVTAISEALVSLVPLDLRGRNDLLRQGEWFFVPIDIDLSVEESRVKKWYCLATDRQQDWPLNKQQWSSGMAHHTARYCRCSVHSEKYVSGRIMDRQHPDAVLPEGKWFRAVRNRQLVSYGSDFSVGMD